MPKTTARSRRPEFRNARRVIRQFTRLQDIAAFGESKEEQQKAAARVDELMPKFETAMKAWMQLDARHGCRPAVVAAPKTRKQKAA